MVSWRNVHITATGTGTAIGTGSPEPLVRSVPITGSLVVARHHSIEMLRLVTAATHILSTACRSGI